VDCNENVYCKIHVLSKNRIFLVLIFAYCVSLFPSHILRSCVRVSQQRQIERLVITTPRKPIPSRQGLTNQLNDCHKIKECRNRTKAISSPTLVSEKHVATAIRKLANERRALPFLKGRPLLFKDPLAPIEVGRRQRQPSLCDQLILFRLDGEEVRTYTYQGK
jgi:hypothetical protein